MQNNLSTIFKALGDDTRLKVFGMLSDQPVCACDILANLDISQPTLSHHMKVLAESGLVNSCKVGAWMQYTLNKDTIEQLQGFLELTKHNEAQLQNSAAC